MNFSGLGFSIPTGGSGSTPVSLAFAGPLLQASGTVTLGIAGASITAFMTFLDTTASDGSSVIDISVSNISVTLGSYSFGPLPAVGLLEIGHGGVAGSLTISGLHFSVGNSSLGASFTSDATARVQHVEHRRERRSHRRIAAVRSGRHVLLRHARRTRRLV